MLWNGKSDHFTSHLFCLPVYCCKAGVQRSRCLAKHEGAVPLSLWGCLSLFSLLMHRHDSCLISWGCKEAISCISELKRNSVSHFFYRFYSLSIVSIVLCGFVGTLVCVLSSVWRRYSWTYKPTGSTNILFFLAGCFLIIWAREWAKAKVKKGNESVSLFAMLIWNGSALCYLKHTQIRAVFPCQAKEKKCTLCWSFILSLLVFFVLNWSCCFWRDKGRLLLDLNVQELRIDIVKLYLHV